MFARLSSTYICAPITHAQREKRETKRERDGGRETCRGTCRGYGGLLQSFLRSEYSPVGVSGDWSRKKRAVER